MGEQRVINFYEGLKGRAQVIVYRILRLDSFPHLPWKLAKTAGFLPPKKCVLSFFFYGHLKGYVLQVRRSLASWWMTWIITWMKIWSWWNLKKFSQIYRLLTVAWQRFFDQYAKMPVAQKGWGGVLFSCLKRDVPWNVTRGIFVATLHCYFFLGFGAIMADPKKHEISIPPLTVNVWNVEAESLFPRRDKVFFFEKWLILDGFGCPTEIEC